MYAGEVIILAVLAVLLLLPWIAVRDAVRRPRHRWEAIGRDRRLWIALIVLLPVLGALLYLRVARPELRAAAL